MWAIDPRHCGASPVSLLDHWATREICNVLKASECATELWVQPIVGSLLGEPYEMTDLHGRRIRAAAATHSMVAVLVGDEGDVYATNIPPHIMRIDTNATALAATFGHIHIAYRDGTWATCESPGAHLARRHLACVPGAQSEHTVAARHNRVYVATQRGELYTWGLDVSRTTGMKAAVRIDATNERIMSIACGERHTAAIMADGSLVTWEEHVDIPPKKGQRLLLPEHIGDARIITPIVDDGRHDLAATVSDHTILPFLVMEMPLPRMRVRQVACGREHTLALSCSDVVFAWGSNCVNQLGIGPTQNTHIRVPVRVRCFGKKRPVSVHCGPFTSAVVKVNGVCRVWGSNIVCREWGSNTVCFPPSSRVRIDGKQISSVVLTFDAIYVLV